MHALNLLYCKCAQSFLRDIGDDGEFNTVQQNTVSDQHTTAIEEEKTTADSADMDPPHDHNTTDTSEEMIKGAHPQQTSDIRDETIVEEGEISGDPRQHGDKDEQGSPPVETTPVATHPHKPRPSSPPTSTGSGSPASSIAGSMKGRRMSKAVVGKIQKEFESREKKLKHDLDEVKAKSRKAVTSLKAQLAEARTRHDSEMESVKREIEDLQGHLEQVQRENESLSEEMEGVRRESEELALSLRDKESEVYR